MAKNRKKKTEAEAELKEQTSAPETEEAAEQEPAAEEVPEEETAGEAAGAESTAKEAEEAKEEKTGFFKKKDKKDKRDEQIADLTDKLQRQMAEFENFRRRTDKEKSTMYDMGARDVVEKLLPVIDNFERGLSGADEKDPFAEGMQMIYKQLMTMLTDLGVEPLDAAGKEFDPELHNAVMHVEDENYGENIVAEELQKGYKYKDHVVRHSMVKVAN